MSNMQLWRPLLRPRQCSTARRGTAIMPNMQLSRWESTAWIGLETYCAQHAALELVGEHGLETAQSRLNQHHTVNGLPLVNEGQG